MAPETLGRNIAKHTFIQVAGRALSLAIAVVTIPIVTRYFGPEQYGFLTTGLSFAYLFSMISEFGFYGLCSRELPIREDKAGFWSDLLGLRLALSILTTACAIAIAWILPYPFPVKIVITITSAAFCFQPFISVAAALLQYRLDTKAIAIGDILVKLGIGVFGLLAWLNHLSLSFFALGYLVGTALYIAVMLCASKRILPLAFRFRLDAWKELAKLSWPFFALNAITFIYFRADSLILGIYRSQSEVGIYGSAYKLLEVLVSFPSLFTGLLLPILSRSFGSSNRQEFSSLLQKGLDSLAVVIFPIVFYTLMSAPFIIHLVAGPEFSAAAPVLRILIVATGVIFFAHLTTAGVAAVNAQKKMVPFSAGAAIGAVILYFLFIPRFSYFGAAWTTLAVELFVLATSWRLVRKHMDASLSFKRTLTLALCAAIASLGFIVSPPTDFLSFFRGSLLFGLMYAGNAFALKALDPSFLRRLIRPS